MDQQYRGSTPSSAIPRKAMAAGTSSSSSSHDSSIKGGAPACGGRKHSSICLPIGARCVRD
eukprot:jgi/Phyca11/503538/fgenesh2_kg.PHYCAscaffold_4_\